MAVEGRFKNDAVEERVRERESRVDSSGITPLRGRRHIDQKP